MARLFGFGANIAQGCFCRFSREPTNCLGTNSKKSTQVHTERCGMIHSEVPLVHTLWPTPSEMACFRHFGGRARFFRFLAQRLLGAVLLYDWRSDGSIGWMEAVRERRAKRCVGGYNASLQLSVQVSDLCFFGCTACCGCRFNVV